MSRVTRPLDRPPLIALVDRAARALAGDMVGQAARDGHPEIRLAHNAVFATLSTDPARTSDMALRAGITKQSMGEVVRELAALGILDVTTDPEDRRAKLVSFSEHGADVAMDGFRYLQELEARFVEEFGEDYEAARRVLQRVIETFDQRAADSQGDVTGRG